MNAPSWEPGRNALMLGELRLPTIGRLWAEFAERSDKEGWPAARFLGSLLEHEVAERAKRRIERHREDAMRHRGLIQAVSRRWASGAGDAPRRPGKHVDNFVDNSICAQPKSLLLIKRLTY